MHSMSGLGLGRGYYTHTYYDGVRRIFVKIEMKTMHILRLFETGFFGGLVEPNPSVFSFFDLVTAIDLDRF
jgi:hypothetical protein